MFARYVAVISRDHVTLTNQTSGSSVAREAPIAFSSNEQILGNYRAAYEFIDGLVRAMEGRARFFRIATVVVSLAHSYNPSLDREAALRLFRDLGFVRVQVH